MPDIQLCQQRTCPKRHQCYRYLALPSPHWQSYMEFTPGRQCTAFLSTRDRRFVATRAERDAEFDAKKNSKNS